jgi:hypothetical protein
LAAERILDAKALIDAGRWSYGYYVAGYAVECGLKSCVLSRMIFTGWIFKEKVKIEDFITHDFKRIVQIAGLLDILNARLEASAEARDDFVANWDKVNRWKVADRYETKTETEAKDLLSAITDTPQGVMPWIQTYW